MAYFITDACVQCGTCADTCPLSIISEVDGKYVIDADACVECRFPALQHVPPRQLNSGKKKQTSLCCNCIAHRLVSCIAIGKPFAFYAGRRSYGVF